MESVFYKYVRPINYTEEQLDYGKLGLLPYFLDNLSEIMPHSFYVVDYYRRNFYHISKNSLILCGYSHDEAINMGFSIFSKIMDSNNIRKIEEINKAGFDLFYSLSDEKKRNGYLTYCIELTHQNGRKIDVIQRFKPLMFAPDGNLWLATCTSTPSPAGLSKSVIASYGPGIPRQTYSYEDKKWHDVPIQDLTKQEAIVATETEKGTPEKVISTMLGCTRSGVRYHKQRIMGKTHTLSIKEALSQLKFLGAI
jgi:DNA-binding CsgD family transcriptional regulator